MPQDLRSQVVAQFCLANDDNVCPAIFASVSLAASSPTFLSFGRNHQLSATALLVPVGKMTILGFRDYLQDLFILRNLQRHVEHILRRIIALFFINSLCCVILGLNFLCHRDLDYLIILFFV